MTTQLTNNNVVKKSTKKTSTSTAKRKAVAEAVAAVHKEHGTEAVMDLSVTAKAPISGVLTGSLGLDAACGGKGLPRGRVVELYGPESSGKSTLAMSVVAEAQKKGGFCLFIDAEHAFDPE
ncbi:MAG: DNA recombination/repair protein RecA, partial [Planctomycetes bacterium]|nr:DNA recombination/repair protein RecA [Planctomycetota bacterium]